MENWKLSTGTQRPKTGCLGTRKLKREKRQTNCLKNGTTSKQLRTRTMDNPSKIFEGDVEFSLGKFDGENVLYDFDKILIYLNAKGKILFGKNFKIYNGDRDIVFKLCNYFISEKAYCQKEG